jgi:putative two-component system response regulator
MTMPFQNKQILLVDDSADIRTLLAQALELGRYVVHQAENGRAALKLLQRFTPDLIISDISMPFMDGIEFYKTVRQNKAWMTIPFIFLTGAANETIQAGRELGAEDYLTKPINSKDLLAIVNARLLRAMELQVAQMDLAYLETVNVLANTIEGRDPYTYGHVERVAAYARRMAESLRWPAEHLRTLEFGARLHDIGKIVVPDPVLKKTGPLSDAEWVLMRQHPEAGAKILQQISHLKNTIPYVLYHHERWNGTGYPHGLRGKEIPVEGRLLAVVDVYDALTTPRPYHPARPATEAIQFLETKSGVEFDPDMVTLFFRVMNVKK